MLVRFIMYSFFRPVLFINSLSFDMGANVYNCTIEKQQVKINRLTISKINKSRVFLLYQYKFVLI